MRKKTSWGDVTGDVLDRGPCPAPRDMLQCYGDNEHGELGIGSTLDIGDEPYEMGANLTEVDLGGIASKVAAGESTTCARLLGSGVKCW